MPKLYLFLSLVLLLLTCLSSLAQDVLGKWRTIDDETGEAKSIVEIYKVGDYYNGKIVKLFREEGQDPDPICDKCPKDDARYNQKIIGMEILRNLKKEKEEYVGGTVLKPDEGKIYKCKIWIEDKQLHIRGYWGFFYRTQVWQKYH